ncbi:DUF3291 domain-containing protein (plasmid) [Paroceanicella profunda]|uniref:DUF3291 domain-containing protein n=1 Tax=Paroceanicella profunda TaxID=2579971 RepID=A0A5B8FJW3_9RHOB|nr:DUF3291 domain-containing protein [Paroceanicella profunda]QDL94788.1 DUF3291 domain-containing protein [Paroceanicella profunda]
MALALYTFGQFARPSADPANDGFHDRNDRNFRAAEHSSGFLGRSGYPDEPGPAPWGVQVYPRFHVENGDGWAPSTLSLWESPEAAMAFTWHSEIHREALRRGREWFVKPAWPPYVFWWVAEGHVPDWAEGVARFEQLADQGPGPQAFDHAALFDADGQPRRQDPAILARHVAANATRLAGL